MSHFDSLKKLRQESNFQEPNLKIVSQNQQKLIKNPSLLVQLLGLVVRFTSGYLVLIGLGLIISAFSWVGSFFTSDYNIPNAQNIELINSIPAYIPALTYDQQVENSIWSDGISYEEKVKQIGTKLLKANNIKSVQFSIIYNANNHLAYSIPSERKIVVSRNVLSLIHSDDELAEVLGHELAHIEYNKSSYNHKILASKTQEEQNFKKEFEADILGVTIMTNAGYNPLASITFFKALEKADTSPQYKFSDTIKTHPPTTERIKVLEYFIGKKFHQNIITNQYSSLDTIMGLADEINSDITNLYNKKEQLEQLQYKAANTQYESQEAYQSDYNRYESLKSEYNLLVDSIQNKQNSIQILAAKLGVQI